MLGRATRLAWPARSGLDWLELDALRALAGLIWLPWSLLGYIFVFFNVGYGNFEIFLR